ncbi:hypothetical protein V8E53_001415 [Lactarius tabidus]
MSAAFSFVKEALFDLCSGLELTRLNSADAEAWLAKFSQTLIAAYSAGAECGINLANDNPVDVFICEVNMYLQPFANEAWFLRYTQEVAAVVDGYRQQAAERRTPVSSFFQPCALPVVSTIRSSAAGLGLRGPAAPLSSRLSSAAVSPVPSLLPAGSLAAVQPAPSNSPAVVALTVPPSAARTSVIVEAAATAASSGSRCAHFEDLEAAEGKDEELLWICISRLIVFELAGAPHSHVCGACFKHGDLCLRESDHYCKRFSQELALQRAHRDLLPACAHRASRTPRVARAPFAADEFEPSWDPCLDSPGPAYDILVGGHFYFPGLESASAALFWRSKVARAEGNYLGAKRHLQFAWSMLSDMLTRCIAPSLDLPQTHCMQFARPSTASADPDATGLPDDDAPCGEGSTSGKGKGWAVVPMDEDVPERPASPSDGGDGDRWDGILG